MSATAGAGSGGNDDYDPLFTMDVVRDFMATHDGKVSNTTLVTHFRSFLNDPRRKVAYIYNFIHTLLFKDLGCVNWY